MRGAASPRHSRHIERFHLVWCTPKPRHKERPQRRGETLRPFAGVYLGGRYGITMSTKTVRSQSGRTFSGEPPSAPREPTGWRHVCWLARNSLIGASAPFAHDAKRWDGPHPPSCEKNQHVQKAESRSQISSRQGQDEITIRGYSPSKKVRTAIIKKVLKQLEASPDHLVAAARKHSKKKPKDPLKQPKLIEIGD
jgi:hypothetical protein